MQSVNRLCYQLTTWSYSLFKQAKTNAEKIFCYIDKIISQQVTMICRVMQQTDFLSPINLNYIEQQMRINGRYAAPSHFIGPVSMQSDNLLTLHWLRQHISIYLRKKKSNYLHAFQLLYLFLFKQAIIVQITTYIPFRNLLK